MIEQSMILDSEGKRQRALRVIETITLEQPLELTLRPWISRRTNEQNARLWLLHSKAAQTTGYAAEEMHEIALCRHFGYTEIEIGGIRRMVPMKRSSQRDKKEFGEFMESTEAWYISELGVWLE